MTVLMGGLRVLNSIFWSRRWSACDGHPPHFTHHAKLLNPQKT